MASPKSIQVTESIKDLKKLLKTSPRLIIPRIRMLIEIKNHEDVGGISKLNLADIVGVNHKVFKHGEPCTQMVVLLN